MWGLWEVGCGGRRRGNGETGILVAGDVVGFEDAAAAAEKELGLLMLIGPVFTCFSCAGCFAMAEAHNV